jgi:hypothetical protein
MSEDIKFIILSGGALALGVFLSGSSHASLSAFSLCVIRLTSATRWRRYDLASMLAQELWMHGSDPAGEKRQRDHRPIAGPEVPMRMCIMLAITVAIVAIGFGVRTVFIGRSLDEAASITKAMAASKTLSPHEIHLNYRNMKSLPDNEVKEPF